MAVAMLWLFDQDASKRLRGGSKEGGWVWHGGQPPVHAMRNMLIEFDAA